MQVYLRLQKFEMTTLQEFNTVQQYINMLFDELQPVTIDPACQQTPLLKQLTEYGRKIIQLSQQSTFKYRNQHFLPRTEVEQELAVIYHLVTAEQPQGPYESLVRNLIDRLQLDRKSICFKQSLPESRIISVSEQRTEGPRAKGMIEEEKNGLRPSKSTNKSRASRVNTAVKEVLQVKGYFEEEQTSIRDFYDKLTRLLQLNKVSVNSLGPQQLKYSRVVSENSSEKMSDMIKAATSNHNKNIRNLCHLVELLHDNMQKRLKNEGCSEGKLSAYFEEVKRMEQVYSFTLSKLLQNTSKVKSLVREDPYLCIQHIQTGQQIIHKLYNLYPTSQSLRLISASSHRATQARSYGVQVNVNKQTYEKKTSSEAYRLQVKIFQMVDRLDKLIKFKKSVDTREIEKWMENVRQIVPNAKSHNQSDQNYQEEFKKLIEIQDKKGKEIAENHQKKVKKLQKKIQQLQTQENSLKQDISVLTDKWEQERKKLGKKLDHEQAQYKKLAGQKATLEVNLSQMLREIEGMREAVRRQGNEETYTRMQLERQREELLSKAQKAQNGQADLLQELRVQKQHINEERSVYHQKIQLVQKQLDQQRQLTAGLKLELDTLLPEHAKLQTHLAQMTSTYEDKIKEVEQMIECIRELQQLKQAQEKTIRQVSTTADNAKRALHDQRRTNQSILLQNDSLRQENGSLREEVAKWKEEGKLTDMDLKTLKDEVDKVNTAYLQSEEVLEATKKELITVVEERDKLFRQKLKANRQMEQLETHLQSTKTRQQALQLSEKDMKDEFYQKCQEASRSSKETEQVRRQLCKVRKQLSEEREVRATIDKELRQFRQDIQTRRESESAQQGKRRLQLESMRVQLRRKNEQLQKQRDAYQERLGVLTERVKQLQKCMGQKQLLARLLQHQSQ